MAGKSWEILHGDVRKICKTLEEKSFDAVLCDPPYGLSFMGRRWDYAVPSAMVWSEVERVMKPGAHAMIFGGSRTFHRLACAVEDGGLEIRDVLMWLYGSGFPKSHDVSKGVVDALGVLKKRPVVGYKDAGLDKGSGISVDFRGANGRAANGQIPVTKAASEEGARWEGYGTALKPAYEPVLLARRMPDGSIAENALTHGTGGLAIDACRIGAAGGPAGRDYAKTGLFGVGGKCTIEQLDAGRWPANVILDREAAEQLDEQSGQTKSNKDQGRRGRGGLFNSGNGIPCGPQYGDSGGASRFFYTPKVDRTERDAGCGGKGSGGTDRSTGGAQHTAGVKLGCNHHPTVKPIDLIRYLATLILPPKRTGHPRRILVPFSGSGSEIIGCLQAGWDEVVGIEREAEYVAIAKARITKGGVLSKLLKRERVLKGARLPYGKTSIMRHLGDGGSTESSRMTRRR